MATSDDIALIKQQELALVLPALDEHVAFDVGGRVRERAVAEGLSLVCDVRTWDRQLFFTATPGTSADNSEWVRRKINVVRRFHKASYRMLLERGNEPLLPAAFGVDPADYVLAGGGFPLRVDGAGIVGCVTISGLPGREDHNVVVEAICRHLGRDPAELALPPG
ncbi:hypothetical protein VE25_12600 [Devosia geojensis]|uniref:Uncharacterized protein n=1 Tax=Devosia geojensis TaxID=443610 RepID=A0A0F5FRK9_9HYPH|nr:heme-degrading domain-containing protein [Devosia geojensis]KKB11468.1 hypothetical protein VE25_12600 [Devosia geojensis]